MSSIFQYVFEQLRTNAFSIPNDSNPQANSSSSSSSSPSTAGTKNLPLASLLPKVKSITARLIPEDLAKNPSYINYLKSITSGPQVSSLCSGVFISSSSELSSNSQPTNTLNSPSQSSDSQIRWTNPNPTQFSSDERK